MIYIANLLSPKFTLISIQIYPKPGSFWVVLGSFWVKSGHFGAFVFMTVQNYFQKNIKLGTKVPLKCSKSTQYLE